MSVLNRYKRGFSINTFMKTHMSLLLLIFGLVGTIGVSASLFIHNPIDLKKECEKSPKRALVLLGDFSDPNTDTQRKQVTIFIKQKVLSVLKAGDRLHVGRLASDASNPINWVYRGCDPGRGENANYFIQTPSEVDKERKQEFLEPLSKVLELLEVPEKQLKTPLIEGIESISNFLRLEYGSNSALRTKFIVITDLLQNSDEMSVYQKGNNTEKKWKKFVKEHQTLFENTEVTIGFIKRSKHWKLQSKKQIKRFSNFLKDSGVKDVELINIY